MRVGDRSTNLILAIVTLVLSALVGLAIPLASGGGASPDTLAWTPPPATATSARVSPIMITPTTQLTQSKPVTTPGATPTRTATPSSPTPTATPTLPPSPTMPAPSATPTTSAQSATNQTEPPSVEVAAESLNLRVAPNTESPPFAIAQQGDMFTVTARTSDNTWLRVCCINETPIWLASDYVTVTGSLENVPIAP